MVITFMDTWLVAEGFESRRWYVVHTQLAKYKSLKMADKFISHLFVCPAGHTCLEVQVLYKPGSGNC